MRSLVLTELLTCSVASHFVVDRKNSAANSSLEEFRGHGKNM
jgi:hypothetical protein